MRNYVAASNDPSFTITRPLLVVPHNRKTFLLWISHLMLTSNDSQNYRTHRHSSKRETVEPCPRPVAGYTTRRSALLSFKYHASSGPRKLVCTLLRGVMNDRMIWSKSMILHEHPGNGVLAMSSALARGAFQQTIKHHSSSSLKQCLRRATLNESSRQHDDRTTVYFRAQRQPASLRHRASGAP